MSDGDTERTGSPDPGGHSSRDHEELVTMVRIASTILQYNELDEMLSAITRELARVINFDRSSVALKATDGKSLTLMHIHTESGRSGVGDGRTIQINDNSVIGWVVLNRKPILRRDISADGRFLEVVKEESLRSDMIVPLISRGNVIGTLNVGSYEPDALTDDDLTMVVNCSNLVCGAIEHVVLLQEAKDMGERYRTLQRDASDMIMLIDRSSGYLIEVNRRCCEALDYTESELLEKTFFELFNQEDQIQARRDFVNILSQRARSFLDRRLVRRNGKTIVVDISASMIEIKSEAFVQAIVRDISERKILEQQVIEQNHDLQEANRKLRDVDQMKTTFLANMSHELRTPLSVIIAYTESLREQNLDDESRELFLSIISENGDHLLNLINDLLDLSKFEVSGAMLTMTLSHLHDVVRSMWPKVLEKAEQKGIRLTFNPGRDVPVMNIDNRRVQQVLLCLVQNAIKFTNVGGTAEIRTMKHDDTVWIQVTDTGAGIPADQVETIFDAFRQVDGSSTRKWGGLGIGLAMARHIVELHNGKIWVETEEGVGSTFTVVLPAECIGTDGPWFEGATGKEVLGATVE